MTFYTVILLFNLLLSASSSLSAPSAPMSSLKVRPLQILTTSAFSLLPFRVLPSPHPSLIARAAPAPSPSPLFSLTSISPIDSVPDTSCGIVRE